ncbi:MAG: hypothetical protein ABSB89_09070 [Candidatus Bathyarchaeia archaeon]|jgi:5-methylcytosine-specific restriction endonuclease McrA
MSFGIMRDIRRQQQKEYAQSPLYQLKARTRAKTKAHHLRKDFCETCGSTTDLDTHHFTYEFEWSYKDCVTVCSKCHGIIETWMHKFGPDETRAFVIDITIKRTNPQLTIDTDKPSIHEPTLTLTQRT